MEAIREFFPQRGFKGGVEGHVDQAVTPQPNRPPSPSFPSIINPPRLSLFVKRRPGKMWAIAQLIRTPSADFDNCHRFLQDNGCQGYSSGRSFIS
jgi:hypothetical protein